jgi:hypothetical protein
MSMAALSGVAFARDAISSPPGLQILCKADCWDTNKMEILMQSDRYLLPELTEHGRSYVVHEYEGREAVAGFSQRGLPTCKVIRQAK